VLGLLLFTKQGRPEAQPSNGGGHGRAAVLRRKEGIRKKKDKTMKVALSN
jgi:hypothetical protein